MEKHTSHDVHSAHEHGQAYDEHAQDHGQAHGEHAPEHAGHPMPMPASQPVEQVPMEHAGHHGASGGPAEQAAMDHAVHGREVAHPAGHDEHAAHADHTGHEQMFRQRFWVCLILSLPVLAYNPMIQEWLRFSVPAFPGSDWIGPLFSVIVFLYGGVPFLQMAVPELQNRQPGMMTLISLAISVAFIYSLAALFIAAGEGFFWELVTLIDVMLLGHWIEMRSVRQASRALDELARLMPDTAERIGPDGQVSQVRASELRAGDLVLVRPGAAIPADGTVEEGESDVNQAMITGESRPVQKTAGEKVIAGTLNGGGSLRVRVTATGEQTALAGIMRLVKQAQESKSRTQVLADRAAGWLFYAALAVAIITAVAWSIAVGLNVEVISRVATVLVIACPHALGLAIPLVIAITTSLAARNGILVRDRLALEQARQVDVVIFDKTGTLTRGEFGVVGLTTADGIAGDAALALAAAVEGDSEHTMAQGIRRSAAERHLALPEIKEFQSLKGRGVQASRDGHTVYVGGPRLLDGLDLKPPPAVTRFQDDANGKGQSVIYLVEDQKVIAAFALADIIRPESKPAVERLHALGVQVAMLTGDSEAVAKAVAAELGIDVFFAQVLPEDKDRRVMELQKDATGKRGAAGRRVAMVGDGVNDAPALTRADVGIAIGSGTDVAIESAGIILVKSNPMDVVKVLELSRASYRKMLQNLFWATGYNIVALPLAAGILAPIGIVLSPAVGALFMSLSTVVVALNAQLLRGQRLG